MFSKFENINYQHILMLFIFFSSLEKRKLKFFILIFYYLKNKYLLPSPCTLHTAHRQALHSHLKITKSPWTGCAWGNPTDSQGSSLSHALDGEQCPPTSPSNMISYLGRGSQGQGDLLEHQPLSLLALPRGCRPARQGLCESRSAGSQALHCWLPGR